MSSSAIFEFKKTLRSKLPVYTSLLTDNYQITNITKNQININRIEFVITVDGDITVKDEVNNGRVLEIGDEISLSNIKYKFALSSIKKDNSNLYFYRNQTTVTATNILKFYHGSSIEISNITTDVNFNGLHPLLEIGEDDYAIIPSEKKFKINIDNQKTLTNNEILNEGFYNLLFWNSSEVYGSLNATHKVIAVGTNSFTIAIEKDTTLNKFFFDNNYDALDITLGEARLNPRIDIIVTDNVLNEKIENNIYSQNNWIFLKQELVNYSNYSGISTQDQTVFPNYNLALQRQEEIRVILVSAPEQSAINQSNFLSIDNQINTCINASLFNQQIPTEFKENNGYSYYILPLDTGRTEETDNNLFIKEYPYKITTRIDATDFNSIQHLRVPLVEFNFKYYNDGIENENIITEGNTLNE